jgi:hypothetical protein
LEKKQTLGAPLLTKPKSSTASSLSHDETLGSEEKRSSRSSRLDFEVLAVDEESERHFVLLLLLLEDPFLAPLPASVAVDSDMFTGIAFGGYAQKKGPGEVEVACDDIEMTDAPSSFSTGRSAFPNALLIALRAPLHSSFALAALSLHLHKPMGRSGTSNQQGPRCG